MSEVERHPDGQISVEQRGHVLLMGLDRREKYNGLTPKMMRELGLAYTRLDEDPALWVGVLFGHGKHFTAGLDLPKWTEGMKGAPRERNDRELLVPALRQRAAAAYHRGDLVAPLLEHPLQMIGVVERHHLDVLRGVLHHALGRSTARSGIGRCGAQ